MIAGRSDCGRARIDTDYLGPALGQRLRHEASRAAQVQDFLAPPVRDHPLKIAQPRRDETAKGAQKRFGVSPPMRRGSLVNTLVIAQCHGYRSCGAADTGASKARAADKL